MIAYVTEYRIVSSVHATVGKTLCKALFQVYSIFNSNIALHQHEQDDVPIVSRDVALECMHSVAVV